MTSSSFTFLDNTTYFDDDGYGYVRSYYSSGSGYLHRVYTNTNIGSINYDTGQVVIDNFLPSAYEGSGISIIVAPVSPNVMPIKNQILLLSQCQIDILDENSERIVASYSNIETIGQTATLLQPSVKLYNF
jgi:hypothetical protein